MISDRKLSRWDRVFLSLSKLDIDFLIHILGAPALTSSISYHYHLFSFHNYETLITFDHFDKEMKIGLLVKWEELMIIKCLAFLPSRKKLSAVFWTEKN